MQECVFITVLYIMFGGRIEEWVLFDLMPPLEDPDPHEHRCSTCTPLNIMSLQVRRLVVVVVVAVVMLTLAAFPKCLKC